MVLMLDHLEQREIQSKRLNDSIIDLRLSTYRNNVTYEIKLGEYTIKTATDPYDLHRIIRLRRHSFVSDFSEHLMEHYIDFDEHDSVADHVMVIKNDTKELLGSYRLICSEFTTHFYSPSQFEMSSFFQKPGKKIELGRACVHKDHRNGIVLNLIWRGIAEYVKIAKAQYMFGCTSIKTESYNLAYSMYWHLKTTFSNPQFEYPVLPKYQFPDADKEFELLPWDQVEPTIPVLLRSYLKAGALICSEPALDKVYGCTDILTVLDLTKMDPKYYQRYFVKNIR